MIIINQKNYEVFSSLPKIFIYLSYCFIPVTNIDGMVRKTIKILLIISTLSPFLESKVKVHNNEYLPTVTKAGAFLVRL